MPHMGDVVEAAEVATATGIAGMFGYLGGALFTLTVGALANTIDYEPLFALLFLFDVVAAIVLWAFVGVREPSAATRRVTRRWNLPAGMRVLIPAFAMLSNRSRRFASAPRAPEPAQGAALFPTLFHLRRFRTDRGRQ